MKPSSIMDYCYGKNPLHFGVGPTENSQMTAISACAFSVTKYCISPISIDNC